MLTLSSSSSSVDVLCQELRNHASLFAAGVSKNSDFTWRNARNSTHTPGLIALARPDCIVAFLDRLPVVAEIVVVVGIRVAESRS